MPAAVSNRGNGRWKERKREKAVLFGKVPGLYCQLVLYCSFLFMNMIYRKLLVNKVVDILLYKEMRGNRYYQ